MAGLSHMESRKRYSWWWDSHISPKNSKWLQENLTGMDSKVKQMIKLIEEDADSFARRAEMYYKRRPELMRLVEESYRAYRALAERYDHATGVIRHAHKTMVEAFPDQDPSLMSDEVDGNSPFMPPSVREFFDPDELQKDALGLSSPDIQVPKGNRTLPEEPEFVRGRKGLKQIDFFEKGRARKGLNFHEAREKERNLNNESNNNVITVGFNDSKNSVSKHDADISILKEALSKLEAEKEACILKYQKSLEKLSNMEKEVRLEREDSDKFSERAIKAEAEVELLKGALRELKAEKELVLLQYQQCLNTISILEGQILLYEHDSQQTVGQTKIIESEVQCLKQDLAVLQAEKETIAAQHKQCSETLTDVENKLQQAEESAMRANERAKVTENKVESLNSDIIELTEEKKAFSVQCQQYREKISSLEFQILFSQEEAQRLNEEIRNGVVKIKEAEEQCLLIATSHESLQSDLVLLIQKMESKNKELTEKQMELNRLWTCVQEERSRFVEAETAFQTLQQLHHESQEDLTALRSELQSRAQIVIDLEEHNHGLQEEVLKIKEDNRTLNEINLSSAISMENMQDEILNLRATIGKLHEEIQTRVNERNVLQQEIFHLREEFDILKLEHGQVLEQMESLELNPESFGSSVMELRDNNLKLNDAYQREKVEKVSLLEKLAIMASLVEKNAVLESSIADLSAELQQAKDKVKTLEETCHILVEERSAIVAEKNDLHSQIKVLTDKSSALSEVNVSLENSLVGANTELEVLKEKSTNLEGALILIGIEKTGLLKGNEILSSQLKVTKHRLKDSEIKCEELDVKNFDLEIEKQLLVCVTGELSNSLNFLKQEITDSAKCYQTELASLEQQLHLLQEETQLSKNLYNDELDTTLRAETEILVLHTCLQDLHGKNTYLGQKCLQLFEASHTSEKHISNLEQENADSAKFYLTQLASFECQLHLLQRDFQLSKNLYNDELDTTLRAEFEISVLHICLQELHGKNITMGQKCFQIFEASQTSEKHISNLEQENADSVKLYQTRIASLESQLYLLQEDAQLSKSLYIDELDTTLKADIEISILQKCLQELHGNNTSLEQKCLHLFEASQSLEKQITYLGQQNADQQVESKALLDVLEKLRVGIFQMATILDIDQGIMPGCMYGDIPFSVQSHSNQVLETSENIEKALTATLDEMQQLVLEKSILFTLLQQLKLEAVEIKAEKCIIAQNLKASMQRLLKLSTEVHCHLEANEGLRRTLEERDFREKMLRGDVQEISSNLLDIQGAYHTLQQANNLVLEENKSLMTKLTDVKGVNCALEEEVCDAIGDAFSLNNIVLVFKDFFADKFMEVKELVESMHQLHQIKITLEEVINELEEKLRIMFEDKLHLLESITESNNELKTLRSFNNQLNDEVSNGKELLHQKETDLFDMKLKLEALLNEQTRMHSTDEDLKRDIEMMTVIKEEQAVLIFKLATENGMKSAENADLRVSKHSLETELMELIKKHGNVKTREVALETELQRWKTKELLYEKEYEELFKEHQITSILAACYHEKFQELHKKYESTVSTISSMDYEAQLLQQKIMVLEVENAVMKAQFNDYDLAVKSLSTSMASLESQAILHEKLSKINVTKDAESKQVPVQDKSNIIPPTGCALLKDLQSRIQAVELAVDDIQKRRGPIDGAQSSLVPTKELESRSSFRQERTGASRHIYHFSDASSEINEFPKDIMLDQISDCSPYGLSSKEITAADNRILELWGTTNKDSRLSFSDATGQKLSRGKKISSSEITTEKEMTVVDKLEISTSRRDPQQTGKKVKILERLHFDADKLANIQKSVQDLKSKVGIAEKSKKTKGVIEYDAVKEQLEEAEEAIEKLFGVNKKLTSTVEDDSVSLKSENGSEESSTVRRRRVLEQIRRASEKISRLHFEVQKLQFLLQKLEGEKEVLVKTRIIPRSPRVRLHDYLYGSSRKVFAKKQKRKRFCGCIQPSTKGD